MRGLGLVLGWLLPGCWVVFPDCPTDDHGIEHGERLQTTIVKPFASDGQGQLPSCGALGDLAEGSVIVWDASLNGPGDGCSEGLRVVPISVSGASYDSGDLTLASGCHGFWQLSPVARTADSNYLANPDAEMPNWTLQRTFSESGDQRLCWPNGDAPSGRCQDDFVANSVRQ